MALKTVTGPVGALTRADEYLIPKPKNIATRKMLEVNLKVFKGEKYLVASNVEMGIFTQGKT